MQAIGRQPQWAPDGAAVHYERHRPEQTRHRARLRYRRDAPPTEEGVVSGPVEGTGG